MKPFRSFLKKELEQYNQYRQTLGYKATNLRSNLSSFDQFVQKNNAGWNCFRPTFFLKFRQDIQGEPRTIIEKLRSIRGFFQFLVRQGVCSENPMKDVPSVMVPAYIPFVFSPEDIEQLLLMIQKNIRKAQKHFFKDLSVYIAIMLLTRCGLRISEPFKILITQYRPDEGTIYIEKTKFKKSRLLPVPKSLMGELKNYIAVRQFLNPNNQNPYLLPGRNNRRISQRMVYPVFYQAVKDIKISETKRTIGNTTFGSPTPHSLRHSFAINTLRRIKESGKSHQDALPVLAAYMGHCKYTYTSIYLKVIDAEKRQALVNFVMDQHKMI